MKDYKIPKNMSICLCGNPLKEIPICVSPIFAQSTIEYGNEDECKQSWKLGTSMSQDNSP